MKDGIRFVYRNLTYVSFYGQQHMLFASLCWYIIEQVHDERSKHRRNSEKFLFKYSTGE